MAERSGGRGNPPGAPARRKEPSGRTTFIVGIVLITLVAAGAAFGFGKLRRGPTPGHLIYAAGGRVIDHDLATGKEKEVARIPKDTVNAFPSLSGRWLAYTNRSGAMWMLDLRQNRRFQLTDKLGFPLAWSTDDRLLGADSGSFVVLDPNGGNTRLRVNGLPGIWIDRKRIVVGGPNKHDQVKFVDADGAGITLGGLGQLPLTVSADGKQLLATREKDTVIAKIVGDGLAEPRTVFDGQAYAASTSPTGLVAFAGLDSHKSFGLWVLQGNKEKPLEVVHGRVGRLTWARTGATIVYQRKGVLYALDVPRGKPKRLSRSGVYASSFAVAP